MNRYVRSGFSSHAIRCLLVAAACAIVAGGCNKQPYSTVKVSGKVTYEDGSVIPAERVRVCFNSLEKPIDPKTYPRAGTADADPKTGEFTCATTHLYGDGIIVGDHKVTISAINREGIDNTLVPPEYSSVDTTPITVNSKNSPFVFKIPKPQR